jgi:hypothetical protein
MIIKKSLETPISLEQLALEKIKYFNSRCSNIEWSGVGVMKVEGSLEEGNLSINVIDIILKDVGTSGYTEYDWGTTLAEYFEENEDKWPVMFFSIHSHHTMGVSPSGTDDKHLYDNIENFPFHLSIIVNNKLDFNARIATDMYITQVEKRGIDSAYKKENLKNTRFIIEYSVPVSLFKQGSSFKEEFDRVEEIKKAKQRVREYSRNIDNFNPFDRHKPKQTTIDFDAKSSLTPYKIFTLNYVEGSTIKEVMDKLTTEKKVELHLEKIEKYLIDYVEEGYDVITPLTKLINLIDGLYDSKLVDSIVYGLSSIGMLLDVEEDNDYPPSNRSISALTDAEFNELVRKGEI